VRLLEAFVFDAGLLGTRADKRRGSMRADERHFLSRAGRGVG